MRKRINIRSTIVQLLDNENFPEHVLNYPSKEDIYQKSQKLDDINPEIISNQNILNTDEQNNYLDKQESTNSLDVPGAELDDAQEITGSEDEENNYYSIGGDRHDNLEEGESILK